MFSKLTAGASGVTRAGEADRPILVVCSAGSPGGKVIGEGGCGCGCSVEVARAVGWVVFDAEALVGGLHSSIQSSQRCMVSRFPRVLRWLVVKSTCVPVLEHASPIAKIPC